MNLIAHAVLSKPDRLVRLGNVLCDFIPKSEWPRLHSKIQEGVRNHLAVDRFTDIHPVVLRSRARLEGFLRFSNPLIDVFYDHFLVKSWSQVEEIELTEYIDLLYADIVGHQVLFPQETQNIAAMITTHDWLNSYHDFEGLERALRRMERRIESKVSRDIDLVGSLVPLRESYDAMEADFCEFWGEIYQEFRGYPSA